MADLGCNAGTFSFIVFYLCHFINIQFKYSCLLSDERDFVRELHATVTKPDTQVTGEMTQKIQV